MKNMLFSISRPLSVLAVLVFCLVLSSMSLKNETQPCVEGHARGAAMSDPTFQNCIAPYQGSFFWELTIEVISTPGKDGCTYEVVAWICPDCQPNQPCPKIACRQVAVAQVSNSFVVWNVTCYP